MIKNKGIYFLVLLLVVLAGLNWIDNGGFLKEGEVRLQGSGSIQISLIVNPGDVDRDQFVVAAVPFSEFNSINDVSNCRVLKNGIEVPSQFEVRTRWGQIDDTNALIRWMGVIFEINELQGQITYGKYVVECGAGVINSAQHQSSIQFVNNQLLNQMAVDTGAAQFVINTLNFNLFDQVIVNGKEIISAGQSKGIELFGLDGANTYDLGQLASPNVVVREQGLLRTILRFEGSANPEYPLVKYVVEMTFYAGKEEVELRYSLVNEGNFGTGHSPTGAVAQPALFKKLSLRYDLNLGTSQTAFVGLQTHTLNGQERVITQRNFPTEFDAAWRNGLVDPNNIIPLDTTPDNVLDNLYTETFSGTTKTSSNPNRKFEDLISIQDSEKGLAIALEYGAERPPKDWSVNNDQIEISIVPDATYTKEYTYVPHYDWWGQPSTSFSFSNTAELTNIVNPNTWNPSPTGIQNDANFMLEGARKLTWIFWLRPHNSESYNALKQEQDMWRNKMLPPIPDPEYIASTGALGFSFLPKEDWNSNAPQGDEEVFNRMEQFFDVQVDPTAVQAGGAQSGSLWDCEYYNLVRGVINGGKVIYGETIFGNTYWNFGDYYSNNHYNRAVKTLPFRDPTSPNAYAFFRADDYKEKHHRTYGTDWSNTYYKGYNLNEKGYYNQAGNTNVGSHQFDMNSYINYLFTGDYESAEPLLAIGQNIVQNQVSIAPNTGGERIYFRTMESLLNNWLITQDPQVEADIISRMQIWLNAEVSAGSNGWVANTYNGRMDYWQHALGLNIMVRAYMELGMNDPALEAMFGRMANLITNGLINGEGPATSYIPYRLCGGVDTTNPTNDCLLPISRLNIVFVASALANMYELTQNQAYLDTVKLIGRDWAFWGWLTSNNIVDKNDPADYHAQSCRSTDFPSMHFKFRNSHISHIQMAFATWADAEASTGLCGNGVFDPGEQCFDSGTPGCAPTGEQCLNCQCVTIQLPPLAPTGLQGIPS